MLQLEAKIETGRHNLKIKMDKDLIILQKEINLHVADIKRIQGLMSRLALTKASTADELRRAKDKSRKTQGLLGDSKKIQSSTTKAGGETSPERSISKTGVSTGGGSVSGPSTLGKIVVDLLLFGQSAHQKKGMTQSFNNTITTNS